MIIDQQPHHFCNGDCRVRVVHLDRDLVREVGKVGVLLEMAAQDVLQRSGGKEILLPQSQFLSGRG